MTIDAMVTKTSDKNIKYLNKIRIKVNSFNNNELYFIEHYLSYNKVNFNSLHPYVSIENIEVTELNNEEYDLLKNYIYDLKDNLEYEVNGY